MLLDSLGVTRAAIVGHSFGGMLSVYFARDYPETTAVLALENPIGLEDYRSAIPPQPVEALIKTEMAQTPQSYRAFMAAFFLGLAGGRAALCRYLFAGIAKSRLSRAGRGPRRSLTT